MVAGFPGSTNRMASAANIHHWVEAALPLQIAWAKERYAATEQVRFQWSHDRTLDRATFRRALVRASQLRAADRAWLATLLGVAGDVPIDEMLIGASTAAVSAPG